jgi:hypothetical protein
MGCILYRHMRARDSDLRHHSAERTPARCMYARGPPSRPPQAKDLSNGVATRAPQPTTILHSTRDETGGIGVPESLHSWTNVAI